MARDWTLFFESQEGSAMFMHLYTSGSDRVFVLDCFYVCKNVHNTWEFGSVYKWYKYLSE